MKKTLKILTLIILCQIFLLGGISNLFDKNHELNATTQINIPKEENPLGKQERKGVQSFATTNKYLYIYSLAHKSNVQINTFIDNKKYGGIQDWVGTYGYDMTSDYSGPIPQPYPGHAGIDVTKSYASPIYAVSGGSATVYPNNGSAGNEVRITNGIYVYRYLHLSRITISSGNVSPGQKIGEEGKTGGDYGTHLHFEVRKNGNPIDPYNILQGIGEGTNTNPNEDVINSRAGASTYGVLDSFTVNNNKITASGWHVTSDLSYQKARYVILLDSTGKELSRKQVIYGTRADVQKVYPAISGSGSSGFSATFDVDPSWWGKDVFILSRYASDEGGNGTVSDYYFKSSIKRIAGLTDVITGRAGASVNGVLDMISNKNGVITVSGWHTTSDLSYQVSRYVILMDVNGGELARQKISYGARPDIQKLYPNIQGAGSSGFSTTFKMQDSWKGKQIFVLSRYASDAGGNNSVSDYYFRKAAIRV